MLARTNASNYGVRARAGRARPQPFHAPSAGRMPHEGSMIATDASPAVASLALHAKKKDNAPIEAVKVVEGWSRAGQERWQALDEQQRIAVVLLAIVALLAVPRLLLLGVIMTERLLIGSLLAMEELIVMALLKTGTLLAVLAGVGVVAYSVYALAFKRGGKADGD